MSVNVIHTVQDLLAILENVQFQFRQTAYSNDFIFRGMGVAKWELLPSIFRKFDEPQNAKQYVDASISGDIYIGNENEMLAHFKKEAGGILPHIAQGDDFTWIQYAQHYGVPTRLLDFTSNPLIALYFCCKSEASSDGTIWIINCHSFNRWTRDELFCWQSKPDYTRETAIHSIISSLKKVRIDGEEEVFKYRPVLFVPAYIDQRMSAQESRFLLWGESRAPLEEMATAENMMVLSEDNVATRMGNDQRFLMKIRVKGPSKHNILRQLDMLGINEKSLFPGLDSIGKYIKNYYRRYPDDIMDAF